MKSSSVTNEISRLQDIQKKLLDEVICYPSTNASSEMLNKKCKDIVKVAYTFDMGDMPKLLESKNADSIAEELKKHFKGLIDKTNDADDKKSFSEYEKISNILMATRIEKALATYYLLVKEDVSATNSIYWSKVIEDTSLDDLPEDIKSSIGDNMSTGIDEMHMAMLVPGSKARFSSESETWLKLIEAKEKSIQEVLLKHVNKVQSADAKDKDTSFIWFLFFALMAILTLLSLYFYNKDINEADHEEKELHKVVNKLKDFSLVDGAKENKIPVLLTNKMSKKNMYKYIHTNLAQLDNKQKTAEKNMHLKDEFLATMSHEIRTPLTGIIGFVKLIKKMKPTKDQDEYLSLIESSSDNLMSIVNNVLDDAKMDANKSNILHESFNIFKVVDRTASSFTQQADHKDIELGVFIDPVLPEYLMGDSGKLSQVLINLVGNAIKFTNIYGKVNIFVQSIYQDDEKAKIRFSIEDNGIGLSKEEEKNIFTPFKQADDQISKKYGGTGLGLSISSKIVKFMGSTIEVESKKSEGTKFFFVLNLDIDKEHKSKEHPDFSNVTLGMALPARSIVRQLDKNLEMYTRYLGANFKIYYYEELFEMKKSTSLPDVMVFDHHYARLSGELELCASINCKSILLTNGSLRERVDVSKKQFSDIVFGPINFIKTIAILEKTRNKKDTEISKAGAGTEKIEANTIKMKSKTMVDRKLRLDIKKFKGLKILFSEDNSINRILTKNLLGKFGLTVKIGFDGHDTFQMYKESKYDLVLMDMHMPIMDGMESAKNIREYELQNGLKHAPIIGLSENKMSEAEQKHNNSDFDGIVIKPLDIDVINNILLKYCVKNVSKIKG
jgi:signal transduction histidine kinase/CheY-like chemotaxis protein